MKPALMRQSLSNVRWTTGAARAQLVQYVQPRMRYGNNQKALNMHFQSVQLFSDFLSAGLSYNPIMRVVFSQRNTMEIHL